MSAALVLVLWGCTAPEPEGTEPAPEPAPWSPPDAVGPYAVGVRTEVIPDRRGGELTIEVWTPSEEAEGVAAYDLPYTLDTIAVRDAPVRGGDHPLVLFSHGHGGSRTQSIFLTERLASHGFVVVAVDHPFDTIFDYDDTKAPTVAALRPGDVVEALDWTLASSADPDHWLAGAVRPEGIGMLGHSFGAWTTLVLAGGGVDLDAAAVACAAPDAPAGCAIVGGIDPSLPVPVADERITVSAALAPGGWYSFSTLDEVHQILLVSGSLDSDLPFDEEQEPTWEALGAPSSRLVLDGAGHFGFTDACALLPIVDCAGAAGGFMEPLRVQELTMVGVTAYFGAHLLGDERYAPYARPDGWDEPDATWEDR